MTYTLTRDTRDLRPGDVITLTDGSLVTVTASVRIDDTLYSVNWDGGSALDRWDARWTVVVPGIRRFDYDGHTEVTITVRHTIVLVTIRMMPTWRSWTRPTAKQLRRWVDEAIATTDQPTRRRVGKLRPYTTETGWAAAVHLDTATTTD